MRNVALLRLTLAIMYWGLCVLVTWFVAHSLAGSVSPYLAAICVIGLLVLTAVRIRNKMKLSLVVLALSSVILFESLYARFAFWPVGYGGEVAGIFYFLPLAGGLLGLSLDIVASLRTIRQKDETT